MKENKTNTKTPKLLFVSVPMENSSLNKIMAMRYEALRQVRKLMNDDTIELIDNTQKIEEIPQNTYNIPVYHVSKNIELLSKANYACFISYFNNSRGCSIEKSVAEEYDINIITNLDNSVFTRMDKEMY